ncbi:hypothetical protein BHU72_00365 [Desulfuribacillus stibiiarsenatis]|uniref:Uncharacterized protein n=1 Tax=Desulfuribacillus stibiiarsenatis TaxID=1390249 RepID=A0A1E5L9W0_9FIRM|nr:hypothetical protein [Desulfuribacillus stibiiarsenatis]OEH86763.1 hypothetical protein BHU72_00365 [Desulfuribacillus stibiiarsenatis]
MPRHSYIVRLNVEAFDRRIREIGFVDNQEVARVMGISTTQIWRAKLPINDSRYNSPGNCFIAGVIYTLGGPFENFFYIEENMKKCGFHE